MRKRNNWTCKRDIINFQAANIITEQILNIQFSSIAFTIWDQLPFLTNEQRGPLDSELIIWTQKTYRGIVDTVSIVNDLFFINYDNLLREAYCDLIPLHQYRIALQVYHMIWAVQYCSMKCFFPDQTHKHHWCRRVTSGNSGGISTEGNVYPVFTWPTWLHHILLRSPHIYERDHCRPHCGQFSKWHNRRPSIPRYSYVDYLQCPGN